VAKKTRARQRKNKAAAQNPAPSSPPPGDAGGDVPKPAAKPAIKPAVKAKRPALRRVERYESSFFDDVVPIGIGMVCAILPAVVYVGLRDLYQLPKTFAMTYGAAWGVLGLAVMAAMGRKLRMPDVPLKWPILGMIGSIAVGVALAPDETGGVLSIFAKMDAYRWGAGLILMVLTLVTVREPRHVVYLLVGMIAGGLFVALVGIGQHHNIDALLPKDARRWVGINRPGSSFGNRNMAAQVIVAVFSAALVFLGMGARWWRRLKSTQALSVAIPAAAALFVLLYYLRLSVTRSAWGGALIGLVVGGLVYLVARVRQRRAEAMEGLQSAGPKRSSMPIVAGVIAVALLGGVVASTQLNKAKFDKGRGDEKRKMGIVELASTAFDFNKPHWDMRFMMWGTTVEAIKARPLGGGAGNWRVLYPQYVTRRTQNDHFSIAKQPVRAHQDFLQFASEYGLQGLLSLLGLIGVALWMAMRTVAISRRRELDSADGVHWMALAALAGVMGIIAICVDACFSFPFQLPAPTFQFCVWVGLIGAAYVYALEQTTTAVTPTAQDEPADEDPHGLGKLRVAAPGVKLALVVAGIVAVTFVHKQNARLLEAEVGFTQGRSKQKRRDPGGGLVAINGALAINPDDFQNHFIQALCYHSLGRMKEAVASIEASLRLYPNLLNAWVNLAMFSSRLGDDNKMNHALQQALLLKPDEPYALNVRAEWLRKRRQHAQIVKELEPHIGNPHLNGSWYGKANMRYLRNLLRAYEATGAWEKIPRVYGYMIKYYPLSDYTSGTKKYNSRYQRRNAQQKARYKRDMRKYHVKSGDAWTNAGKPCKAVAPYQWAAIRGGIKAGDEKRKYAIALLKCGKDWKKARHEIQVAISANRGNKFAIAEELRKVQKNPGTIPKDELQATLNKVLGW